MTSASPGAKSHMSLSGMKMARAMTMRPMTVMSRSMMVTTRRREPRSRRPQYWAVMTAVPLPTPMQKM